MISVWLGFLIATALTLVPMDATATPFSPTPLARTPFARTPFARTPFARTPFARTPFDSPVVYPNQTSGFAASIGIAVLVMGLLALLMVWTSRRPRSRRRG